MLSPRTRTFRHPALRIAPLAALLAAGAFLGACHATRPATSKGVGEPAVEVAAVLDRFHVAASRADFDAYFACFHDDAIFLGTDASERWTVAQFKDYARPYFAKGRGWTYVPRERHTTPIVGHEGLVFFDEVLENEKYGTCRGSGVLRRDDRGEWRLLQYNLAFAIPNEAAEEATAIGKRAAIRVPDAVFESPSP